MSAKPLEGVVVLDLTQIYNGPYATYLMAAAGAEVIKIEPPEGEHLRKRASNRVAWLPYAMLNAGKLSLKLDLKAPQGRDVLLSLAEKADVLVENFAAGVMDRLGLGAAVLHARNPRLVIATSTGYGGDGPYRDYPAMDLTMQAMSGVIGSTGYPDQQPVKAGPAVSDFLAGIHLYSAAITALLQRDRTGRGRTVEVSMMEASYFSLCSNLGMAFASPELPARTGNRHGALAVCPYNVYPAADGHIAIIVNHDQHWRSLTGAMGREELADDPRYRTNADRVRNMQEVDDMLAAWSSQHRRAALFEKLIALPVPCAPVRDLHEVMNDPHLHARGMLQWREHPEYGRIPAAASPLRFEGEAHLPERPSVPLGHDSRDILRRRLGMAAEEIDQLARLGVI